MAENNGQELWRSRLVLISEEILQKLLAFKKFNPDFTFALRERDSVQSEEERLRKGQWFQGSGYIYVPLFKRGDKDRKVKTIGFVISFNDDGSINNNFIEISFKRIGDDSEKDEVLHRELATKLGIELNDYNVGRRYYENSSAYLTNLDKFLKEVYPVTVELIKKHGLTDKYVVGEHTFKKRLAKINEIKNTLSAANTNGKASAEAGRKNNTRHMHLNLILYGPPGTGKTYNSIDYAVKIATGQSGEHTDNKTIFDKLRKDGQIAFVTFHQNYGYEDFMVGIAPDISSENLKFRSREGVFKRIADQAKSNWLAASKKEIQSESFSSVFDRFFYRLMYGDAQEIEIPMRSKGYSFKITSIDLEQGRIKFTKQSGGTTHDLLFQNVKKIYEGTLDYGMDGLGVYYYPLVEKLKASAKVISDSPVELKNFALVIDEINRANISKVFGELITLIEDDKRLGEPNELTVTLPNGDDFGVPPNLYIIGTMNTADKSIALIDIALRRRFEFIGKYPDYEVLKAKSTASAKLLEMINTAIYKKKSSADFLIGHAYFLKDIPIKETLANKVIPLLMEYFSGKTDIITEVFNGTGWKVKYNVTNFQWDIHQESNV